jgi:hypothetical protein
MKSSEPIATKLHFNARVKTNMQYATKLNRLAGLPSLLLSLFISIDWNVNPFDFEFGAPLAYVIGT